MDLVIVGHLLPLKGVAIGLISDVRRFHNFGPEW